MSQLMLGTAEFNPVGYGGKKRVPTKEIKKIFSCAREAGIILLDTAESYNCQGIIQKYAKGFCIYTKTRDWKVTLNWGDNELRGILYHYRPEESKIKLPFIHRWVNLGASVYNLCQLPEETRILQIPINLNNFVFENVFKTHRTIFARSVFANGKLFDWGYSIKDCLNHVKQFRPDGIIVGVNKVKELEAILKVW